jgi:hypothetical protein
MRLLAFLLDPVLCLNTYLKWSVRELRALGLRTPVSAFGKNLVLVTHGQGTSRCKEVGWNGLRYGAALTGLWLVGVLLYPLSEVHIACVFPRITQFFPKWTQVSLKLSPSTTNVYFCHFTKWYSMRLNNLQWSMADTKQQEQIASCWI